MKIYLESSVPNFLFHSDSPEKQEITKKFFQEKLSKNKGFISDLVLDELEKTPEPKRSKLRDVITKHKLKALKLTKEARVLAEKYIEEGIIPQKYSTDALHIAIAVINKMDALVSWNMEHIVKLKTIKGVNEVNKRLNYPNIFINTPEEI